MAEQQAQPGPAAPAEEVPLLYFEDLTIKQLTMLAADLKPPLDGELPDRKADLRSAVEAHLQQHPQVLDVPPESPLPADGATIPVAVGGVPSDDNDAFHFAWRVEGTRPGGVGIAPADKPEPEQDGAQGGEGADDSPAEEPPPSYPPCQVRIRIPDIRAQGLRKLGNMVMRRFSDEEDVEVHQQGDGFQIVAKAERSTDLYEDALRILAESYGYPNASQYVTRGEV